MSKDLQTLVAELCVEIAQATDDGQRSKSRHRGQHETATQRLERMANGILRDRLGERPTFRIYVTEGDDE